MDQRQAETDEWEIGEDGTPIGAYPNDPNVPDIFAEGVGLQINPANLSLVFNKMMGYPARPQPVAVIRMTLPQAFVMTQVLRKVLRDYQEKVGPIYVPGQMLVPLDLDTEL